ncbi:MAG: class I SAM-dependent rRNA methyltransferase [Planctomycetota bacterium]|nr:MAG: class I SAM-dependent rRNA methyltransferase [Planctomycetota bacterium]
MRETPRQTRRPTRPGRPSRKPALATAAPPAAESPWVQLRSATNHPFIFERMIGGADPAARPGDVVTIYDKAGRYFGRGIYNPRSQVALRVLTHESRSVDDAFWREAVERAVELRRALRLDDVTDAYRLVHSEGDGLSGLILERFADCLVFEVFSLGIYQRYPALAEFAAAALGPPRSLERPDGAAGNWRVFVRADESIERTEGFSVRAEECPDAGRLIIREHGIRYRVDIAGGHKTGFFCDQRDNRRKLAGLCRDANVLDMCCYTGGFGLAAKVLGGAKDVTCVDLDEAALAVAKENINLNNTRITLSHADAFNYFRQMISIGRKFDVLVLDPPKLATSRAAVDEAMRKYYDLNGLGMQVVRRGGLMLTCSCSGLVSRDMFVQTLHRATRPAGRTIQLLELSGAGPDHPVMLNCPESVYLKAAWLRVM